MRTGAGSEVVGECGRGGGRYEGWNFESLER